MQEKSAGRWMCVTLAVVALAASVGFYSFPLTEVPIGTDSAVFGYIGEVMAAGGTPYLDVFDHKGPLVYLINLLGALGPSTWVLWLIEWLFLASSLCLAYGAGRAAGAPQLAAAAVPVLLVPSIVYRAEGGNMTEEYCLPFILASVMLSVRALRGAPLRAWHAAGMGACAACVFMLRFTGLIGLLPFYAAAFALTWKKRKARCALARLGAFALGSGIVAGSFAAWLGSAGALSAFFEHYLAFNVTYAFAGGWEARWESLLYFASDPALLLALAATGTAIAVCWARRARRCGRELAVIAVNFTAMALLFALAALSGRNYGHYFLMFVPTYVIAYGIAAAQMRQAVKNRAPLAVAAAAVLLAAVYVPASLEATSQLMYRTTLVEPRAQVVSAIEKAADGGDVLVIGNECWVYLDGGFRAPEPYAYRSDVMAREYDAWLAKLVDGQTAPAAIAVAWYVDTEVELGAYEAIATVEGFEVYAKRSDTR